MPMLWYPLTVYRWRSILTHFPFLQPRPRGLLVFQYGGGILENEKTLGTTLFIFHFPTPSVREGCRVLQFCVRLSQESRSLVIALSQAVSMSRSNIYVFNKRLPTTCFVGGLESFQNKRLWSVKVIVSIFIKYANVKISLSWTFSGHFVNSVWH